MIDLMKSVFSIAATGFARLGGAAGRFLSFLACSREGIKPSVNEAVFPLCFGDVFPSGEGGGRKTTLPDFVYIFFTAFLVLVLSNKAAAQPCLVCPTIEAILVDACGTEQDNEFVIINSGSGFNTSNLQLDFDANNNIIDPANNDINTDNGNIAIDPTPCGLQPGPLAAISGCSNVTAVGPGVDIPANSIVVLFTSSNVTTTYDFSNLCGSGQCIYVIASTCARTAGGFTNSGPGTRTTILTLNGCACANSATYDRSFLIGGNGAYYGPNLSPQYGNPGCASPPGIVAPFPNNIDDIPDQNVCGTYTLPSITGTGLTGNEAFFAGSGGTGTQFTSGQNITSTQTLFIYDPTSSCSDEESFTITINTPTTPTLTSIGPFCSTDASLVLNTTQSGITGNWSGPGVALNSLDPEIAGGGTHTLTFTPNPGQCANPNTLMFTVTLATPPALAPVGPFCSTDAATVLNTTQSGITGSWSGTGVSGNTFDPAIAGQGPHTLTFTPNPGQCAADNTIGVTVNVAVTPSLTAIGPFCATDAAMPLNTTQSGIAGTWSGPGVSANSFNPATAGAGSHTLTFTPNAGQCALVNTTPALVNAATTPALTPVGPLCSTDAAVPLNTTQSGISGAWSGPGVAGNSFNPASAGAGNHTLTFTPTAGQCANVNTMMVLVNAATTPTLTNIGPFCANDPPIALNTTQSGITGTWSGPGVTNNTFDPAAANTGSNTLTFTPDAGQCASPEDMTVTVNPIPTANPTTFNICVLSIVPPTADYDLPGTENVINGGTGFQVNWYNDAAATSPINDINDVAGLPSTVFATVFDGQCESATVPVAVQLEFAPASQNASAQACDSGDGTAVFDLTTLSGQVNNTPGVTVTFYLDNTGLNPVPNPGNFTATNGTVLYAFASTPSGCRSAQPGTVTLTVVNGIDPAAVALGVSPTALCGPGDVTLTFTLPIGGSYTVAYAYSNAVVGTINSTITTTNGGSTIIFVDATTDFYITQVSTGSCSTPITPTPITVTLEQAPDIFPISDVTACGSYTLPPIQGNNLTTEAAYHTGPSGTGITYFPGEVINSSITLYALDFVSPLCLDEEVFQVTVTQAPDLILNEATEICPGGSLNLQNVVLDLNFTGLPVTFHSANPPTTGNQLNNSTVSPGVNTTYFAYADGGAGCQDVLAIPVTLLPAPVANNPGIQSQCDPGAGTAVFNLTALNPQVANGQSVTVSWFSNAGATIAINNPDAYSSAGGLVYATVSNGQCTSQPVAVSLVINPNPAATVANTVDPDCTVGNNGSISIAVNGGSSPYNFDWNLDALDGQQNPTGLEPGDYSVTVTDQNGCSDVGMATLSAASGIELACGETIQASSPGASDGQAIVIITGGVPPFELTWSGPVSGNQTLTDNEPFFINNIPVGEYSLVLTDSQGCETTCEFSMSSFGCNILVDITGIDPTCPGSLDGSISLDVQNTSGAVTFNWDADALDGTEDPTGLGAGTYTVTVTDAAMCEATASLTLNDPPALILNCGQNSAASGINTADGSALIGFGGGTPPYTFDFAGPTTLNTTASNASAGTVFPGLLPGDYLLTFTDAHGCSTTCNFTINGPGCFVQVSAEPTDPACAGEADGAIDLTVTNAAGNLAYNWNVDALDGQSNPTGLAAGTYSVTVTDANNCTAETSAILTDPPVLLLNCAQQSPVSMVGTNDGAAAITIGGGTTPYTLTWAGPVNGNQNVAAAGVANINNLAAGNYTVTLTDANGCTQNCGFTINSPNCDLTLDIAGTDVTCPGAGNGSINLTINNGDGPFAIDWNVNALDAVEDPTNLAPGLYAVTVTDIHACTATASVNIGTAFSNPGIAITAAGSVCASDCTGILLNLTGNAPFTLDYQVTAGGNTLDFSDVISLNADTIVFCPSGFGLSSGNITVHLISLNDANCQTSIDQVLSIEILPESNTNIVETLCDGESILVNGTEYNQANPSGTEMAMAANGCDSVITVDLTFFPKAENTIDRTLCPGETLLVGTEVFSEANPSGTVVLPGAAASGCDSTVTVTLGFFPAAITDITTTLCPGEEIIVNNTTYNASNPIGTEVLTGAAANGCDSTVNVQLTFFDPVVFDYQETVCEGFSVTINNTVYDRNNPSGTEVLAGAAANGCDSTVNILLTYVDAVVTNIDSTLCPGASLTVNGTVYDAANPAGTEVIPGGSASGCDSTIVVNLNFHPSSVTNISGPLCPGESITVNGVIYDQDNPDGTEVLTASTGCDSVVVITLTFYPGSVNNINQTLCEGESLTINGQVYDQNSPIGEQVLPGASANGCDSLIRVNLNFTPPQTAGLTASGPICPGGTAQLTLQLTGVSGTVDIVISGGATPLTINGAVNGQTIDVSPQTTTAYFISSIVAQGSNCPAEIIGGQAIVSVSGLQVSIEATSDFEGYPISCAEAFDGNVTARSSGGVSPIFFTWDNGTTSPFQAGLGAGMYSVTATDAAGCTGSAAIALAAPPAIQAEVNALAATCFDENSGQIVINSVTGGVPPFEYSLDGLFFKPLPNGQFVIPNLQAGAYTLQISDVYDCTTEIPVAVDGAEELLLDLGPDQTIRLGESAELSAMVNFEVASLVWSPTDSLRSPENLTTQAGPSETTIYTLTITEASGCQVSDQVTVFVNKQGRVFIPNIFSPDGDGNNDRFTVFAGGEVARVNTFKVFDRWGNLLFSEGPFEPNNPGLGWNGEFQGRPMNAGVYVFYAEVEYLDGRTESFKGDVTLMR